MAEEAHTLLPSQDPPLPTITQQENKDEAPPKRMISLKHVKSTDPPKPATERKRVFLPETDAKQDFPISVSQKLSIEQLQEALRREWKFEDLNSPPRMRDAGLKYIPS